ncbi:stemmadenine O-acetyltransferase-like [Tripterygium wilfordii]|uniref:stemmadenine O-acetyltransferase-like n=1 Tax=Tripterygium wilfordii TaxID=458696 RepID=UPI0018F7F313|nr:stemmadenine O-acetyltransferase-like [Tripterygium wilfordii]
MKLGIRVISRDVIKPSSPKIHDLNPYKLCLFDQLTPHTYVLLIFFYPRNESNSNINQTLTRLKSSLSETLNLYHPFSGRTNDNIFVDRFEEGVPFIETRVDCTLSKFLKHLEIESLDQFLPCKPFCNEDLRKPLNYVQVNVFACGGIALTWCLSHKIIDGATISSFFHAWAAISRGFIDQAPHPNLTQASTMFPPAESIPRHYLSLVDNLWFRKGNYVTRLFFFNSHSISRLKAKIKGIGNTTPSANQALCVLLWKYFMIASREVSSTPKLSVLVQPVNLRPRTNPPMSSTSTGNIFRGAIAVSDPAETHIELEKLLNILTEAIAIYDSDYLASLQGHGGFEVISERLKQQQQLVSSLDPEILTITSCRGFGFNEVDFGFGKPVWLGVMGKGGQASTNFVMLHDSRYGNDGIEAWVTLDEPKMRVLEHDHEFLTFVSPNHKLSSL